LSAKKKIAFVPAKRSASVTAVRSDA